MDKTPLLNLINDQRQRGEAVALALQIDAVVDAVARGWGDQLLARVEDVARNGAAITDLCRAHRIIQAHDLDCTIREVSTALLRYCSERVYGPADWRAE